MAAPQQTKTENASVILSIDDSSRTMLAHTTHPQVSAARNMGLISPTLRMERMMLVLGTLKAKDGELRAF